MIIIIVIIENPFHILQLLIYDNDYHFSIKLLEMMYRKISLNAITVLNLFLGSIACNKVSENNSDLGVK